MTEVLKKLHDKADRIANLMLIDIIHDADLLTVALCAGTIDALAHTLCRAKEGEYGYIAAHKAMDIGCKPDVRDAMKKVGYFAKGLRGLLELAERDPDAGARLMPVFCTMASEYRKYGVPRKLKNEVMHHMEYMYKRDGFAITLIDDGSAKVKVSDEVFGS